jgi:hypothetical protein
MRQTPSSTDLVLIDGLLSMFARRTYGALDLGLALLLDSPRDKYPPFVAEHVAGPMRALSEVLRLAVREAVAEPASSPFEAIAVDTERFSAAMLELADFGVAPSSDMEAAAARLGEALRRLDDSVRDVGERLGFEPAAAREMTPERRARYREIVEQLPADLAAERTAGREPGP